MSARFRATFTASSAPVAYISQTCRLAAISASVKTARRNPAATPSMRICRTTAARVELVAAGHRDDLLGERDREHEQRDDGHLHDRRRLLHELVASRRVLGEAGELRQQGEHHERRQDVQRVDDLVGEAEDADRLRFAEERQQDDVDAPVQRCEDEDGAER